MDILQPLIHQDRWIVSTPLCPGLSLRRTGFQCFNPWSCFNSQQGSKGLTHDLLQGTLYISNPEKGKTILNGPYIKR